MIFRITTLAVMGIVGGYIGYMVADNEPPIVVTSKEAIYTSGRTVKFRYEGLRTRACGVNVTRFFFDSEGTRYNVPPLSFPKGALNVGKDIYTTMMTVPEGAAIGKGTYRTLNCYVCNPFHYIHPICTPPRDIEVNVTKEMSEAKN